MSTRLLFVLTALLFSSLVSAQDDDKSVDPFEAINRPIFEFNEVVDRVFTRPLAVGYDFVMPHKAQRGVQNLIANLYDLNAALNSVLQGRPVGAVQGASRFVVNSTIGLFGLVDVASAIGITPYRTDFGHTLALWGFKPGPYVMTPFFGPRTVRSGTGTIFDTYASLQAYIQSIPARNGFFVLEIVVNRAALVGADGLLSGDRYIFIRNAYMQQREYFVNDGVLVDDFSNFEEDFDWE